MRVSGNSRYPIRDSVGNDLWIGNLESGISTRSLLVRAVRAFAEFGIPDSRFEIPKRTISRSGISNPESRIRNLESLLDCGRPRWERCVPSIAKHCSRPPDHGVRPSPVGQSLAPRHFLGSSFEPSISASASRYRRYAASQSCHHPTSPSRGNWSSRIGLASSSERRAAPESPRRYSAIASTTRSAAPSSGMVGARRRLFRHAASTSAYFPLR
jgi:hypothetical protein